MESVLPAETETPFVEIPMMSNYPEV